MDYVTACFCDWLSEHVSVHICGVNSRLGWRWSGTHGDYLHYICFVNTTHPGQAWSLVSQCSQIIHTTQKLHFMNYSSKHKELLLVSICRMTRFWFLFCYPTKVTIFLSSPLFGLSIYTVFCLENHIDAFLSLVVSSFCSSSHCMCIGLLITTLIKPTEFFFFLV